MAKSVQRKVGRPLKPTTRKSKNSRGRSGTSRKPGAKEKSVRKRVRKKNQQILDWLDLAQQAGSFVLFDWNPQTEIVEWSGDIAQIFGVPTGMWKQAFQTWSEIVHPEDNPRLVAEMRKAFAERRAYEFDHRVTWPDGSVRWVSSRGVPTKYNAEGKPTKVIGINQLIDARKREEELLRHRTEELEKLMDVVPAAIWVAHDPQCYDITGNRMANQFYEAAQGENVSATSPSGVPVQTRRFFSRGQELKPEELPMQAAAAMGIDIREAELEVVLPSGKRFSMLGSASPLRGPGGEVRGCVAAFIDVTQHKAAERAVSESELRFRSLFERHKAAMLLIEPVTGEIVAANPAAGKFYGLTTKQLQQMRIQDINALRAEEVRAERQRARDEQRNNFVFPHRVAGGGIRWVEVYTSPVEIEGRTLLFSIIHDITERKEAQERLASSEEHFRLLVEQASDGIFVSDTEGYYREINTAGCEMLGYSREELVHLSISDILAPYEVPRLAGELAKQADGQVVRSEWTFKRKDGSFFLGEVAARQLPDGRLQAILRDITDRKRADEALIRSEKLASAGRMAATIAHEINNPLAAAVNAIYLAGLDPKISDETRELLQTADEELRRATEITRQTLGFYRENGRSEPVMINSVAEKVLNFYGKRLEYKGIAIKRKYRDAPIAMVVPGELRQVIANLISNAMDASSHGGVIHVRASSVGSSIAITIADTGTGIDHAHKRRVFEPFFTTKENIGTGLGLWVSNEIIKKHGGRIRMRSQLGRGTVFGIFLPNAAVKAATQN